MPKLPGELYFSIRIHGYSSGYRIPKNFQGRGFQVSNTHDIPNVLRSILSDMVS